VETLKNVLEKTGPLIKVIFPGNLSGTTWEKPLCVNKAPKFSNNSPLGFNLKYQPCEMPQKLS